MKSIDFLDAKHQGAQRAGTNYDPPMTAGAGASAFLYG